MRVCIFKLIKGSLYLCADRCGLKEPGKVEQIQWRLIQCLLHMLKKNHKSDSGLFAKVIDRMMESRTLTEWNYKIARRMHIWPAIQQSPLLVEMISMWRMQAPWRSWFRKFLGCVVDIPNKLCVHGCVVIRLIFMCVRPSVCRSL